MNAQLSRRQIKAADRVGGIELICRWPVGLPPANLADDKQRPTTPAEHAAAERLVRAVCDDNDLVPVRSTAVRLRRPSGMTIAPGAMADHLAIVIIGSRWVHATGAPTPRVYWCTA